MLTKMLIKYTKDMLYSYLSIIQYDLYKGLWYEVRNMEGGSLYTLSFRPHGKLFLFVYYTVLEQ